MMRSMRAFAPWIMTIVALTFVGWMVFEVGMDVQGTGGVGDEILRINGTKIEIQAFYQRVRAQQDFQRQQGAPPIITIEDQRALEDAVVEQIVQEVLLQGEYRRRGIEVSDDDIANAILNLPFADIQAIEAFQTDGVFDIIKYQRYLTSGADPAFALSLEQRYREQMPLSRLANVVTEDIYISDGRLWQIYRDSHDSVTANVLTLVPAVLVPDAEVEPSDDEVRSYYRSHRDAFERRAQAYLSYVEVPRIPDPSDSAAALARVEELREEILAGTDFEAVAARESSDSASRQQGGDVGERPLGTFVAPFEEAALSLRPGQISQPVLTQFGYHLIRLESKTDDGFHARHILIPIELQGDHLEVVDARADSLDILAAERDDPDVLDTVAAVLGIDVLQAGPVLEGERAFAGGVIVPDAGLWAFEAIEGQTSQVIEADWAFYVFRLDSLIEAGVPPVDEIRPQIALAVRREKKSERTAAIAETVATDVADGMSLQDVAAKHGLTVLEVGPFTRVEPSPVLRDVLQAIGGAFGLPLNEVGGPYVEEFGIFFVQPTGRTAADSTDFLEQKETLRREVLQAVQRSRLDLLIGELRTAANVVDLRQQLLRASQRAPDAPFGGSPLGF